MLCLHYFNALLLFLLWSNIDAHLPSPFDVRIDHYKIDTIRDLVINTPRPRVSWKIPPSKSRLHRNVQQIAYQIQLQSVKLSQQDKPFHWDSERVISSQSIHVPCTDDMDLLPSTYYHFRVRVWTTNSDEASEWTDWIVFRTSIFNLHEYLTSNADLLWIGSTKIYMNELRKEFTVPNTSPVKSAIVYLCGLGYYEFYLNGNNVDPSRKLDPGWTTYEKRTLLVSFDVTPNITFGENAVGVKLGNGWYSREQGGPATYGPPRLLFTLNITLENGDQMQVLSDQTWRGRVGAIKHDSIYNGEIYDRRDDRPDWARAGFNDPFSAWIMPESLPSPVNGSTMGLLVLQDMPPIRAGPDALHLEVSMNALEQSYLNPSDIGQIKGASLTDGGILQPVAMWISESNIRTFDLGQNTAGWCRVRFRNFPGPPGFSTYIRHGEILVQQVVTANHSTGNIYTTNLRRATAADAYIIRGDPVSEVYEPTFTVHGFRYMSVSNSPSALTTDDIECLVVHSETTLKGHFTSSNPIVNQIQHNIQWGQLSNIMSLPTDSPQRDERRGYLGDAALSADEALYNFDLIKFYLNFLNLIVDIQLPDGELPDLAPGGEYPADTNFGSALPTITWLLYQHYGDAKTLEAYYNSIRSYVEFLIGVHNKSSLAKFFCAVGDWVPPPPHVRTNCHLLSSFGFLHDVNILVNISQVLGRQNDTEFYSAHYQQLAKEFHLAFFNTSTNFYADGMQAAQVLALALPGVVPADVRSVVVDYLVRNISENGNHVTTGIVSTARIYPVLSDNGHHDLALEMISSTTYPSYGYMFTNPYENATTIGELWNAPFEGPSMNSRNHIMYGSVGAWFYSHLAGIDLSSNMITIRPRMASEAKKHLMAKLDCQLSTLHGVVHVSYTRDERDIIANSILLRVTIPVNARARVMFEPLFVGGECAKLMESDELIWSSDAVDINAQGWKVAKDVETNVMSVDIGSGEYEFQAMWK